jgi:hypothetical protein
MDTLHKKLSEIRDLRAEELDMVVGAYPYEGGMGSGSPTWASIPYMTSSMVQGPTGYINQTDDSYVQNQAVDRNSDV